MRHRFSPNWKLILILVIPVWAIVLFVIWAITYPAFRSLLNGTPFPSSWTWFTILLFYTFFFITGLFIMWTVAFGFLTEFTDTHIRRHLFFWRQEILLTEIKQMMVSRRNFQLILNDGKQNFAISLMLYKKPEEVLSFIKSHIQIQTNSN
jgi:hypothetical protein